MSDYRISRLAYPPSYLEENGAEIVALANDLSSGKWSFRQSRSLIGGGLRTRARVATECSVRGVWESGARTVLLIFMVIVAASNLAATMGLVRRLDGPPLPMLVLSLAIMAALTQSSRPWVAVLITAHSIGGAWWILADPLSDSWVIMLAFVTPWIAYVGLAWWLALTADGRRACAPLQGIGFLVTAILVGPVFGLSILIFAVGLVVAGVILAPGDPRLMAAVAVAGVVWSLSGLPLTLLNEDTGLNYWGPIIIQLLIATVPIVVTRWGSKRMVSA